MTETIIMMAVCGILITGVVVFAAVLVWSLFTDNYEELPRPPTIFGDDDDGPERKQ